MKGVPGKCLLTNCIALLPDYFVFASESQGGFDLTCTMCIKSHLGSYSVHPFSYALLLNVQEVRNGRVRVVKFEVASWNW